ncbi:hypothetical protein [Yeosuana marina]|uniref:hypothetical protein n=1 Tax=Yeosuana marina TaxID=1565536 RepID=UPI0030C89525
MEILLIIFLLLLLGVLLYLVFRVVKWIFNSKARIVFSLILVVLFGVVVGINKLFFQNMEFIQSNVYPDLYLVKHPIKDKDSINNMIEKRVLAQLQNGNTNTTQFYEYTTAWGFQNGTKHFINHKEDPGGFSSEELNNYQEFKMAYFSLSKSKKDTLNYYGILRYFKDGYEVKKDTIFKKRY